MTHVGQFLIEHGAHDGTSESTKRYATSKGFRTGKTETPALAVYEPRIVDAGSIESYLFKNAATSGNSFIGAGKVILNNADNALDYDSIGVGGRDITIREKEGDSYPADFPIRFSGSITTKEISDTKIALNVGNKTAKFAKLPYQTFKYGGNNTTAIGLEGTVDDIKGLPKPKLKGHCANISPILVNASGEIYQLSSDEVDLIVKVMVGRAEVTVGTEYSTLALFQAEVTSGVPAGEYAFYLGDNTKSIGDNERGCFMAFGTTPSHQVTVNAHEGAAKSDRSFAQIAARVVIEQGYAIDATSISDADIASSAEMQYWSGTSEVTVGSVMDSLAAGGCFFWTDDIAGNFIVGQFSPPKIGDSVLTISNKFLLGSPKIKRIRDNNPNKGVPIYRANVTYDQNYTIMNKGDLTGIADTSSELAFVTNEYRSASYTNSSVQTQYLNSPEWNVETNLVHRVDAEYMAQAVQELYGAERLIIEIKIPVAIALKNDGSILELNSVITVEDKLYRIIGLRRKFPKTGNSAEDAIITIQAFGGNTSIPADVFEDAFSADFE